MLMNHFKKNLRRPDGEMLPFGRLVLGAWLLPWWSAEALPDAYCKRPTSTPQCRSPSHRALSPLVDKAPSWETLAGLLAGNSTEYELG